MMDHLQSTTYQGLPAGNSLENTLEVTAKFIAKITAADVAGVLACMKGLDVVAAKPGNGTGTHKKLVRRPKKHMDRCPARGAGRRRGSRPRRRRSSGGIRYNSHGTAMIALSFISFSSADVSFPAAPPFFEAAIV